MRRHIFAVYKEDLHVRLCQMPLKYLDIYFAFEDTHNAFKVSEDATSNVE